MNRLNVLVIEPEASARLALVEMLKRSTEVVVIGVASDVIQARMQIKLRKPNMLILATDQQPDAVDKFLMQLMQDEPLPVLMLSGQILPKNSGEREVMRAGGSLLAKPRHGIAAQDESFCRALVRQLKSIVVKMEAIPVPKQKKQIAHCSVKPVLSNESNRERHNPLLHTLVAIGASTGGTEALRHVVSAFPAGFSPVLIVQHLPKAFAATFINKLNKASKMNVVAAEEGVEIQRGHIYVGAGGEQFRIEKSGSSLVCRVGGKDKVSGHCPSVNELFDSVAKYVGSKAVGALMTGMGDDGASGLKKMRDARAKTVVQDKASSVVWGMPGAAIKLGASELEVPLAELGKKLTQLAR